MDDIKVLFQYALSNKWKKFNEYLKLHENVDVNIKHNNNYLINYAIISNNIEAISLLIKRNSYLDFIDIDGKSILFAPIKYNYLETIKLLLYFNKTSIGINLVDIQDNTGMIPLHYAINIEHYEIVSELLKNGSNVNILDNKHNNALHLAILTNNLNICKLILEYDVNLNTKNKNGMNCLHLACDNNMVELVKLMMEKNIDLDMSGINDMRAIHYACLNNNEEIVKILIDNNCDLNSQDIVGNTPLHILIMKRYYKIVEMLLDDKKLKYNLNFNIHDINNNLPIHLYLSQYNENKELTEQIILKSNLNKQNKFGNTPLHYIVKLNIWKKYERILKNKKLNINIKNKNNKYCIDYITKDKREQFYNLIAESYYNLLKTLNKNFLLEWENECAKVNSKKYNKDKCLSFIKKKLKSDSSICDKSYPSISKKCPIIKDSGDIKMCTFTGHGIDIISGLIYLNNKFKTLCVPNNKLKILDKEKLLKNFEILWSYEKLIFPENFDRNILNCTSNESKYIVIPLGIENKQGFHSNCLLYDVKIKEIERFEPYGSSTGVYKYNYSYLDKLLKKKFSDLINGIKYISPIDYLPKCSFQTLSTTEIDIHIGDPEGFCALWVIWYIEQRLTYNDFKRNKLVNGIIKYISLSNLSYKKIIRNYSENIVKIRDNLFEKASIDINDWINDKYTNEQIKLISKEINKKIF